MSLFRKAALDALSTPEQLNDPLQLLRPSQWILLISLSTFSITILVWSIFGRIPVRVSGKGVLIKPNTLSLVQSETSGPITSLPVKVGDCIEKGRLMAEIEPVSQEIEMKAANIQLEQMLVQDKAQDMLGKNRLNELESEINRVKHLADSALISEDDFNRRQRELSQLRYSLEAEDNQRELRIKEQQTRIDSKLEEIERTSKVNAPVSGCIIDSGIHEGEIVQAGATLFTMQEKGDNKELESIVFFPSKDGKRLKIGQRVRISPTTTKQQRHGGIEGKILSMRTLPVRDEAVVKRLGIQSLLESVRGKQSEPLIEVTTTLQKDEKTQSGYDWGGSPGPQLKITAGTTTKARVLVEERRPISYVVPILRDLTGIY